MKLCLSLPPVYRTALLLTTSNTFMTFAWYAYLRNWNDRRWYIAAGHYLLRVHAPSPCQSLKLNFLWDGLCLLGAGYFIFRG